MQLSVKYTLTPLLTKACTWLGLRGALLSHTLVSSLLMASTLPSGQPAADFENPLNNKERCNSFLLDLPVHILVFEVG